MENKMEKLLKRAGDIKISVPDEVDDKIIEYIYSYNDTKYQSFFKILKPAFVLGVIIFLFLSVRSIFYSNMVYKNIMNRINSVQRERDVYKALDLYSQDFFTSNSKKELKENIESLFTLYKHIKYIPRKDRVILKGNRVLIENNVYYKAESDNKMVPKIEFKGKERIYLKKVNREWKIFAWVYDKNYL